MPILFDYDPVTKVTTHFDYDPLNDVISMTYSQDVSQVLKEAKNARDVAKMKGQVETFAHYAIIPPIVEMELAKKGIRLNDKNATKALIREIETNYPGLKTTNKRHSIR